MAAPEEQEIITSHLLDSTVKVDAVLGKVTTSLAELRRLNVGDVLVLNTKISDLLTVQIENEGRFLAQPGLTEEGMAVQIVDVIKN